MITLTYNLKYNSEHVNNIIKNINYTLNLYDIDFLLFQEATIYKKIIKIIDKNKYSYILNKSHKEDMITFYKKSYVLLNNESSEFKEGRPFNIMLFENTLTKKLFYLINIHACHNPYTLTAIIKPINEAIKKIENEKAKEMIIGGDFNRDILFEYEIETEDNNYVLKNVKNNVYTYSNGKKSLNFDHVISTKKPIKKITIDKYKPASDHLLTLVELKDI